MTEVRDCFVEAVGPSDQLHQLRVGQYLFDPAFKVGQHFASGVVEAVHRRHGGKTIGEVA